MLSASVFSFEKNGFGLVLLYIPALKERHLSFCLKKKKNKYYLLQMSFIHLQLIFVLVCVCLFTEVRRLRRPGLAWNFPCSCLIPRARITDEHIRTASLQALLELLYQVAS